MKNNFIRRTVTGVLFVALLVGCILYGSLSFGVLFAGISALTLWEFSSLMNTTGEATTNRVTIILGGMYLFLSFMMFCTNIVDAKVFIPYLLIVIYLLVSELYLKRKSPIINWAYAMLSQFYIALPFALLNVLAFHYNQAGDSVEYNPILPLSVFVFIWLSDTGAYCVGTLIGKHKLFERISPKKSWEGFIGGCVFAVLSSFAFAYFFPFMSFGGWAGLALVVAVFGTWGDLVESLLKRQLGIKDSGKILPGHGGMLDRFDSALLALPAAVVYLYLISLI